MREFLGRPVSPGPPTSLAALAAIQDDSPNEEAPATTVFQFLGQDGSTVSSARGQGPSYGVIEPCNFSVDFCWPLHGCKRISRHDGAPLSRPKSSGSGSTAILRLPAVVY